MTIDQWLSVCGILAETLTAGAIFGAGIWLNKTMHKLQVSHWASTAVIQKRLEVYDKAVPLLNEIYCFFTYLGVWKELTPSQIIQRKRELDKLVHVYAPLFSEKFFTTYYSFMGLCFETFTGWGNDPRLKTHTRQRIPAYGSKWVPDWDQMFSDPTNATDPEIIKNVYENLIQQFASELSLGVRPPPLPRELSHINYK